MSLMPLADCPKSSVDHPRGQHDDVVNAAALVLVALSRRVAQHIPLVAPCIIYRNGTSSLDQALAGGDTRSTTQRFYDWADSGGLANWWGVV
jgi:hypothetical protein